MTTGTTTHHAGTKVALGLAILLIILAGAYILFAQPEAANRMAVPLDNTAADQTGGTRNNATP